MGAKPPKKEPEKTTHPPSATNGSSHTPKGKHKGKADATPRILLKIPLESLEKKSSLDPTSAVLDADAINREIIENAPDIIYMHDLDGNFTYVNGAVAALLGYSREEAVSLN